MGYTYAINELFDSRTFGEGQRLRATLRYHVRQIPDTTESPDEAAAYAALLAAAPTTYSVSGNALPGIASTFTPLDGNYEWIGTVEYGFPQSGGFTAPIPTGGRRYEFTGGTSSLLITESLSATQYDGVSPTSPLSNVINADENGVQGLNIEEPEYAWTERHYVANASATWANQVAIAKLRKTVNNAAFRSFAAGEVLFDDFSAAPRTDDDWEYVFKFRARPNYLDLSGGGGDDNSLTIGGISGIDKKGWQYLDVRYKREQSGGAFREAVDVVIVHDIFREVNFSALGIGTGDP